MTKFITNQNIEINLELASLGDRIIAFFIDMAIIITYFVSMSFLYNTFFENSEVVFFIMALPVFFYTLTFETLSNGQTPGKKSREIKVVKLDGSAPSFFNFLLRWVLRPIDFLLYGSFAIISIISTQNGQRIGDLAAGTTVIKLRSSFKLSDVGSIQKDPDYKVVYPQVKRLNDKQIEIIRRSLKMRKDGFEGHSMEHLAEKTKQFLKIDNDVYSITFLYTVVKDYEHLHSA